VIVLTFSGGTPSTLANNYQGAHLVVFSIIEGGILCFFYVGSLGGTTPPSVEILVFSL
jgi:hypothetical protein